MRFRIKAIVAIILALSIMLPMFCVVISADEGGIEFYADNESASKNKGLVYSCVYDSESQKIVINGSVTHDIFVAHRDYNINLYKIAPEHSLKTTLDESDVTLLASTSISIKFNFTAEVREIEDIFSQYVVTLVSKTDEVDYVGERLYPFVESEYESDLSRASYKGVRVPETQEILQADPSVAIVPVYLDKLVSSGGTGYLYSLEGKHIFFDKEYVDSIGRTVRSLYSGGAKVYLQLLLSGDGGALYDIPDIYSFSSAKDIYSCCDFLSGRYSSYKNGFIDGIIIGKNLDETETYNNNRYGGDAEKYIRALALYGVVVGTAVRKNIPSADISYSFTNANTYGAQGEYSSALIPSLMIEKISAYIDSFYSDVFDFSVTLESSHRPFNISNETLEDGINLAAENDPAYITDQNADVFSSFLDSLDKKYSSSPKSYIYVWNVDKELSGNALCCAYTYLYYKRFSEDRLGAFVVSFDDNAAASRELISIIKYIDTDKGRASTSQLLGFFRVSAWKSIIPGFKYATFSSRKYITLESPERFEAEVTGEFLYFDFSDFSDYNSWFAGRGFGGISIDYYKDLGRSLCARFNADTLSELEYAYLFNAYEYSENFGNTPYLTLKLAIEDNDSVADAFELCLAFESDGKIYEASKIVHTGEVEYLYLDISDFVSECVVDNMRISVRPMSDASGEYKLFISSLKGESLELDGEALKTKIVEERLRIRDSLIDEDEGNDIESTVIVIIITVLAAVILTVTLFFFLRKEDNEEVEDDDE